MAKARIAPPRFIKQRLRREESLLDRRSTQSVVVNCYTSSNVSLKHTTRIDKGSPLKCLERILTPCCALVATRLRVGKWVISRFPSITPLYDFIALNTKNRIKGVMTNLKISQPLCNYCVLLPFNSRFFLRFSSSSTIVCFSLSDFLVLFALGGITYTFSLPLSFFREHWNCSTRGNGPCLKISLLLLLLTTSLYSMYRLLVVYARVCKWKFDMKNQASGFFETVRM